MLKEDLSVPVSGLVTFESISDMRMYIRQLLSYYERQYDLYSQKVGSLMRLYEKKERGREARRFKEEDWQKVGMLMVNTKDSLLGTLEIMLDAMEEYKVKMNRTNEVLTGFDELEELNVPDGATITLFLRHGVPLRVLVDIQKTTPIEAARPVSK